MKNFTKIIFIIILIFVLTSCSSNDNDGGYNNNINSECQHVWEVSKKTDATCVKDGKIIYICEECQSTKEEKISAKGHKEVVDEEVAATCTQTGLTEGVHCSRCDEILVSQEVIEKDLSNHDLVDSVCVDCGYVEYSEGLIFTLLPSQKAYAVSGYQGTSFDVVLPDYYNDLPVTHIAKSCFQNYVNISSIRIGKNVTNIESYAFNGCTLLTEIVLPESVKTIGFAVFKDCTSLQKITMPFAGGGFDGVENTHVSYLFGANQDENVNDYVPATLTEVIITGGISIGANAFKGFIYLRNITIPNSVENIEDYAFDGCVNLSNVILPEGLKSIGSYAFNKCESLQAIVLPNGITEINDYSFAGCSTMSKIDIHDNITRIGSYAFNGCSNIKSINIPSSVTSIGSNAFAGASELSNVFLAEGLKTIGSYTFASCYQLTDIIVPLSVTSIGIGAFQNCSMLSSLTLPFVGYSLGSSNTHLGYIFGTYDKSKNANFVPSSLKSVILTGGTDISSAFDGCSYIQNVVLPDDLTIIGYYAFRDCSSLKSIDIPENVTSIRDYAFSGCNLTNIIFPDTLKSIGSYAFSGCKFKNIVIPESVNNIGKCSFEGCNNLESMTLPFIPAPQVRMAFAYLFADINATLNQNGSYSNNHGANAVYVPSSLKEVIVTNDANIEAGAFSNCLGIEKIVISDNTTKMNVGIFYNCPSLKSITLPFLGSTKDNAQKLSYFFSNPDSTTNFYGSSSSLLEVTIGKGYITNNAFSSFYVLDTVIFGSGVNGFGSNIFPDNPYVKVVVDENNRYYDSREDCNAIIESSTNTLLVGCCATKIPNGVTSIAEKAFYNCAISEISIPSSVISIASYAFYECSLKKVYISEGVSNIDHNSFYKCKSLENIMISENNLYYDSRNNCNAIIETSTDTLIFGCANTVIPGSVRTIGGYAFEYYSSLYQIVIPEGVVNIRDYAFSNCYSFNKVMLPKSLEVIGDAAFPSNIKAVLYAGTEEEWNEIEIMSSNFYIAEITYNFQLSSATLSVSYYNYNGWKNVYAYVWKDDGELHKWPGELMTLGDDGWYTYVINSISADGYNIIFNNGSTLKTEDIALTDSHLYFYGDTGVAYQTKDSIREYISYNGPQIGVIGSGIDGFSSWSQDVFMELNEDLIYETTVTVSAGAEFKIRLNSSWDENYGGTLNNGSLTGISFGSNIVIPESGTYRITFDYPTKKITVTKE